MDRLYDISEVCTMLGTTSRTLRFYEEKGLITSTLPSLSQRRKYTEAQLSDIKNVLVLRSLGLPVATISELLQKQISLEDAIVEHKAELLRLICEKQTQINLLEDALFSLRYPEVTKKEPTALPDISERQLSIADECTAAILNSDFALPMSYFSEDMQILLPPSALKLGFERTIKSMGRFLELGGKHRLKEFENVVLQYLHYEKQTVRIKYVFHGEIITGLWTDYAREEMK